MKTTTSAPRKTWCRNRLGMIGVGAFVATALLVAAPAGAATTTIVRTSGPVTDLQVGTPNPTDGAFAQFLATGSGGSTTASLFLYGLDKAAAGHRHGAHVHTGPCVTNDGAAAGPHYNIGLPPSPTSEVWLDFTILASGSAYSTTTVPFQIAPGTAKSVVIHASPTAPGGAAGARIACLPVAF